MTGIELGVPPRPAGRRWLGPVANHDSGGPGDRLDNIKKLDLEIGWNAEIAWGTPAAPGWQLLAPGGLVELKRQIKLHRILQ